MDGTPILDIKPYIPYADSHPEAREGFTSRGWERMLEVDFPPELLSRVPEDKREALIGVLANDPRPSIRRTRNGSTVCPLAGWRCASTCPVSGAPSGLWPLL